VAIGDLSGPVAWDDHLAGVEAIVHIAGLAHQPPGTSDRLMFQVNAEASEALARAAARHGIARMIHVSSVRALVGPSSPVAIDEAAAAAPTDSYGRSKLAAEQAIAMHLPHAVSLRPALIAGAGASGNLAGLARAARMPIPLPFAGLRGRRSLTTDRSVAAAIAFLLARPVADWPQTALIAHDTPLTLPEIVAVMRAAAGRRPGLLPLPRRLAQRAARLAGRSETFARLDGDLVLKPERLARLGWTPPESLESALARLMIGPAMPP
jgi:UDP-glucose 4-epimerase